MLIMGEGRSVFILRKSECGLFSFLRWPLRREELLPCYWWLVAGGGGVDEAGEASADEAEA